MTVKAKSKNNNGITSHRDMWGVIGKMRERLARLEAQMAIALVLLVGILLKLFS
jgi:hypothetical protein